MRIYWRLGYPGWRLAAAAGLPIQIKVDVLFDEEAGVYYATSDDIGLAVESASLDGLLVEINHAIPLLLSLMRAPVAAPRADIRLHETLVTA